MNCFFLILSGNISFQATRREKEEIRSVSQVEESKWGKKCSLWGSGVVDGNLDGFWPDFPGSRKLTWMNGGWNNASIDELGPIGTFVLTIDGLSASTKYNLLVRPVVYPQSNSGTAAFSIIAHTKPKGTSSNELVWMYPRRVIQSNLFCTKPIASWLG